ncbi:MAG: hypothetical protein EB036_10345, partial [Betaproteobacteria bacterium]|nr:hypothetical protein [Betaproteobacteria bacterium]
KAGKGRDRRARIELALPLLGANRAEGIGWHHDHGLVQMHPIALIHRSDDQNAWFTGLSNDEV